MARERVNIPVEVTGDAAAKKKLGAVGQAAGRADQRHARGKRAVAGASKEAAKQVNVFDDSARTAVRRGLSAISPALGEMVSMVNDLAKGVGRVSIQLLAFAGVGLALAGVVAFFRVMKEAAEKAEQALKRYEEARKASAQESISLQAEMAQSLKAAGLLGRAKTGATRAEGMIQSGVPREMAVFVSTAAEVSRQAGRELNDEELRHAMGSWIAGGERTKFEARPGGQPQAENEKLLKRLLAIPRARAQAALDARLTDLGLSYATEGPLLPTSAKEQRFGKAAEVLKGTLGLTDREVQVLRGLHMEEKPPREFVGIWDKANAFKESTPEREFQQYLGKVPSGDATHTIRTLLFNLKAELDTMQNQAPVAGQTAEIHFTVNNVAQQTVSRDDGQTQVQNMEELFAE